MRQPGHCLRLIKLVLVALFLYLPSQGQEDDNNEVPDEYSYESATLRHTKYKPLKVNDHVKDFPLMVLNDAAKKELLTSMCLSDYQLGKKMIILDFWATWCSSCIKQFPKLDSLQKLFKNEIQIILVNSKSTKDDEKKVNEFFANRKRKHGKSFDLIYAVNDTIADKLFPHRLIPHYVIIAPDGRVQAITSSDQITAENIRELLTGNDKQINYKKDLDTRKPLFLDETTPLNDGAQHSIFVPGRIAGLPSSSIMRMYGNAIRGRALTNTSLLSMYKIIFRQLFPAYNNKNLLLEVHDTHKLISPENRSERETWYKDNLFTFELVVPLKDTANLYSFMLEDLNRYSGYHGRIEKRKVKCLILTEVGSIDKIKSLGGKLENKLSLKEKPYINNVSLSWLAKRIDNLESKGMLVLDETVYKGAISIQFATGFSNIDNVHKQLQQVGLDLVEAERELEMFVISDKLKK